MSVLLETSVGDIVIDLEVKRAPKTCLNFLKLCKIKYYNFVLFHNVQKAFMAQAGDPTATGTGGESVWGVINGPSQRYFTPEIHPKLKHKCKGTVSMATAGMDEKTGMPIAGSQFFITLAEGPLDYLDGKQAVFGHVAEGEEVLQKLNEALCDDKGRPFRDIRIKHTVILDDPFEDPEGLIVPSRSPSPTEEMLKNSRIGEDEELFPDVPPEVLEEEQRKKEAAARALTLEMVGDLPFAEIKPPENVLFVCKLNPVTRDEDLELIFSRFGSILSCEIVRDKKTGDSLSYAFIEFENQADAEEAYFKMDNVLIDDRRIHVDFSQSVSKLHMGFLRGERRALEQDEEDEEGGGYGGSRHLQKKTRYRAGKDQANAYDLVFDHGGNLDSEKREKKRRKKDHPSSRDGSDEHDIDRQERERRNEREVTSSRASRNDVERDRSRDDRRDPDWDRDRDRDRREKDSLSSCVLNPWEQWDIKTVGSRWVSHREKKEAFAMLPEVSDRTHDSLTFGEDMDRILGMRQVSFEVRGVMSPLERRDDGDGLKGASLAPTDPQNEACNALLTTIMNDEAVQCNVSNIVVTDQHSFVEYYQSFIPQFCSNPLCHSNGLRFTSLVQQTCPPNYIGSFRVQNVGTVVANASALVQGIHGIEGEMDGNGAGSGGAGEGPEADIKKDLGLPSCVRGDDGEYCYPRFLRATLTAKSALSVSASNSLSSSLSDADPMQLQILQDLLCTDCTRKIYTFLLENRKALQELPYIMDDLNTLVGKDLEIVEGLCGVGFLEIRDEGAGVRSGERRAGVIVGGIVGGLAVVGLAVGGIVFYRRRKRTNGTKSTVVDSSASGLTARATHRKVEGRPERPPRSVWGRRVWIRLRNQDSAEERQGDDGRGDLERVAEQDVPLEIRIRPPEPAL
ncbi:Peptidyl-prolyl cis-trans isomerase cyp6 [Quaeritorhiza haematococci]|nr:Peptidyl-prolyl cis-trans isomerase cyp6 [Quaeritorhiza haematococci]